MADETTSVLIVGGGPVGLATAVFLARQGVRPILLERRPGSSIIPRATGLHARTMELFRSVGLEEAVAAAGLRIVGPGKELDKVAAGRATPLVMRGAQSLAALDRSFVMEAHDPPYADFTPSWPIWCGQDHYEPILLDAARAHGADIRFDHEVRSLTQDAGGVEAVVEDLTSGTSRTIRADYAVAADGVRSPVREALGIGQRSQGVAGQFVSIIFRANIDVVPEPRNFTLIYVLNPRAQGLLLFIEPGRWMFGVNYDPERGEAPADFTQERCVELVRIAAGVPDLAVEVESATPWEAKHMVADTFQSGRVFLAGDACHAHPPAGGFGVNAGIQDAHNLAWKLAAVVRGQAAPSLLDTYDVERRPVGAATADQAWMLFRTRGQLADEDRAAFRDFVIVTMGYRYDSAAVVGTEPGQEVLPRELTFTGAPGSRAPHVWLSRAGQRVSTIDLFGSDFVLLAGEDGAAWLPAAKSVAGGAVRGYLIGSAGELSDPDGAWAKAYGVSSEGAVLIRPDGFVAWRSPGAATDPERELAEAVAAVLGTKEL